MFAFDLISSQIPSLSLTDKIGEVLLLMSKIKVEQLPVTAKGEYVGLVEELTLKEKEDKESLISGLSDPLWKPAIDKEAHFFDVLKVMNNFQLDVLPVIDQEIRYHGAITSENFLKAVVPFNSFSHEGSLLILKMVESDYMLSKIATAAEREDVSLLGVHTLKDEKTGILQVLLKTNRFHLDSFITSLEYLGYEVAYRFDKKEDEESIQKNYEHLMNYINM